MNTDTALNDISNVQNTQVRFQQPLKTSTPKVVNRSTTKTGRFHTSDAAKRKNIMEDFLPWRYPVLPKAADRDAGCIPVFSDSFLNTSTSSLPSCSTDELFSGTNAKGDTNLVHSEKKKRKVKRVRFREENNTNTKRTKKKNQSTYSNKEKAEFDAWAKKVTEEFSEVEDFELVVE